MIKLKLLRLYTSSCLSPPPYRPYTCQPFMALKAYRWRPGKLTTRSSYDKP